MKNTEFILLVEDIDFIKEIKVIKNLMKQYPNVFEILHFNGSCKRPGEWNDHEINLKDFSSQYSDSIFKLFAYENNRENLWLKIFKNGEPIEMLFNNEAHENFYTEYIGEK